MRLRRLQRIIAFDAVQFLTKAAGTPFLGRDPKPLYKWRRMADVLCMAALKLCDPMAFIVGVEADNFAASSA
jgi:hypothetical protein